MGIRVAKSVSNNIDILEKRPFPLGIFDSG